MCVDLESKKNILERGHHPPAKRREKGFSPWRPEPVCTFVARDLNVSGVPARALTNLFPSVHAETTRPRPSLRSCLVQVADTVFVH